MKLGLVSNPGSERNKRGLQELDAAAAGCRDLLHVHIEDVADLRAVLTDFARREVGAIVVAGGDGTVQATLTALLERPVYETQPLMAVLPRGMTNLIAGDVGLRGRPARALARLQEVLRGEGGPEAAIRTRAILRLDNLRDQPPQWGMYLGVAGVVRAARFCMDRLHSRGVKHQSAVAATLIGLLLARLVGHRNEAAFGSSEVSIGIDNAPSQTRRRLLAIVTTLDKLILGSRPFWNLDGGEIRYTSIGDPAPGLVCKARRVLYGGNERRLPAETYESRSCHRLEIGTEEEIALDGQFLDVRPDSPFVVTAPKSLRFVSL